MTAGAGAVRVMTGVATLIDGGDVGAGAVAFVVAAADGAAADFAGAGLSASAFVFGTSFRTFVSPITVAKPAAARRNVYRNNEPKDLSSSGAKYFTLAFE